MLTKRFSRLILSQTLLLCLLINGLGCSRPSSQEEPIFRLGMYTEPGHLDPQRAPGASGNPLLHNLYRGLYRINGSSELEADGGHCTWQSPTQLLCQLKQRKWSDGRPILADDYVYALRRLASPESASPWTHLLKNITQAEQIFTKQIPADRLGVEAAGPNRLVFHFARQDPQFLFKLSTLAMVPRRPEHEGDPRKTPLTQWPSSGPLKLKSWQPGVFLELEPHPDQASWPLKVGVRFYVLESDRTSLRLYHKGELDFVRRIPSENLARLSNRQDFHWRSLTRFDYLGFAGELAKLPNLRRALTMSVDYSRLQSLLRSKGRPGCPSFSSLWTGTPVCLQFDLARARQILAKVPPQHRTRTFHFYYSQMGGEDIRKQAEFFQAQWREHLDLKVELHEMEQKSFLTKIRSAPPDMFRKGVKLDWPSCHQAFESLKREPIAPFLSQESLDRWLTSLSSTSSSTEACRTSVHQLLQTGSLIPLGQYEYGVLANNKYQGWTLNELNQLDLSQLRVQVNP